MNTDFFDEYADAAKKIHASPRFRNDTLRKIRYQAALQNDTAAPDVQEEFIADDDFDIVVSNTDSMPQKSRRSSPKQRFRSLLGVAASVALIGGMAAFLYHKASSDELQKPAENGTVSTTSSAMEDKDHNVPLSPSAELVLAYQQNKGGIATLFTTMENGVIHDLYQALNPPHLGVDMYLCEACSTLNSNRDAYERLTGEMLDIESDLCLSGDVAIYDVLTSSDGTLQILIANGTDEEINISSGYKISNAKTGVPIIGGSLAGKNADLEMQPHSTTAFTIADMTDSLTKGVGYCVTVFDGGYRLSSADSGVREFTFVYYGNEKERDLAENILIAQGDEPFQFDFSMNDEALMNQPSLADVQAHLQTHHNVEELMKDYEPVYTFSSKLWGFSPYQTEVGPTTRRIWILKDGDLAYIEDLNGEYHLITPDVLGQAIE